jgi:hypothetical protein
MQISSLFMGLLKASKRNYNSRLAIRILTMELKMKDFSETNEG